MTLAPNGTFIKMVDNYAGEEYAKSVRQVLAMYNAEAPKMTAAERARRMAWREEQWLP